MYDIIAEIRDANLTRNANTLHRRIMKLGEEFGEVSEAYLNVTSAANGKGMTWDDVREEFADLLIVAVDVALTPLETDNITQTVDKKVANLQRELEFAIEIDDLDALMLEIMDRLGQLAKCYHQFKYNPNTSLEFQRMMRYVVSICATATQMAMPDQRELSVEALQENLASEIARKLAKWKRNRDTAATDGTD